MLIPAFKYTRIEDGDRDGFNWLATSHYAKNGIVRNFTAQGKTLADVKEFAALVRLAARTGKIAKLSEMHPPKYWLRFQSCWGGTASAFK